MSSDIILDHLIKHKIKHKFIKHNDTILITTEKIRMYCYFSRISGAYVKFYAPIELIYLSEAKNVVICGVTDMDILKCEYPSLKNTVKNVIKGTNNVLQFILDVISL